jgi:hypothetical protein
MLWRHISLLCRRDGSCVNRNMSEQVWTIKVFLILLMHGTNTKTWRFLAPVSQLNSHTDFMPLLSEKWQLIQITRFPSISYDPTNIRHRVHPKQFFEEIISSCYSSVAHIHQFGLSHLYIFYPLAFYPCCSFGTGRFRSYKIALELVEAGPKRKDWERELEASVKFYGF